ncbi:MAG: PLP-dependent aminotransferase family protein [Ruminococcaceae bacterium]|nr:PLP-dependent aminotransferase family protein [Oscillospiraceae bacterium]
MDYNFSKKISGIRPSAIREILKLSSDPSVIPFSAGNPSSDSFPFEDLKRYSEEILSNTPTLALQYGVTEGYLPLRNVFKDRCKEIYGAFGENDELIVTTGAQQVFDLLTKTLCDEGDTVISEGPAFVGALTSFKSNGANVVQVDVKEDGMDIDELTKAIETSNNPRFIYCIPNFQNPTGLTTSAAKRREILEVAKKYDLMVLEDNAYADLRFSGEEVPSIKSFDTDGRVVYAGSMSKLLSPGLRVGFASGPSDVIAKMTVAKQVSDVHTAMFNQMICHMFFTKTDLTEHISKIRKIYREKAKLMLDILDKESGGTFRYTRPEGGLFIWCNLTNNSDAMDFTKEVIKEKVAIVPGNAFYADDSVVRNSFRLNFSSPTEEQITVGTEILCRTAKSYSKS